jgi:hypothetical protein
MAAARAFELIERGGNQTRRSAERMAERDRAATGLTCGASSAIPWSRNTASACAARPRSTDDIDVGEREAGLVSTLRIAGAGPKPMMRGGTLCRRSDHLCLRFQTVLLTASAETSGTAHAPSLTPGIARGLVPSGLTTPSWRALPASSRADARRGDNHRTPFFCGIITGTISSAPAAPAATAAAVTAAARRECVLVGARSWSTATFSAVSGIESMPTSLHERVDEAPADGRVLDLSSRGADSACP